MKTHISFSLAGILLLVVAASTAVYINQSASTDPRSTADSSNLRQLDGSSDSTNPDQLGSQSQLDCSPTDDSAVCPKSQQPVVTRAAGDPFIERFGTITGTDNGWYGLGETIKLVAIISEGVTVTGTPILNLNSGGTAEYERTTTGNTLVFRYIVGEGDTTKGANANAGQDLDVDSFNLNGAQIVDNSGAELDTDSLPTVEGDTLTGSGRNLKIDASSVPTIGFEINRFDQLSADSNLVDEEFVIHYQHPLPASDVVCDDSFANVDSSHVHILKYAHGADRFTWLPDDDTKKICLRLTEDPDLDEQDYQYIIYADSTDYPQLTIEDPASDAVTASVTDTVDGSSLPSFDYQVIDWDVSCDRALTDFLPYTTGVALDYRQKVCFKAVDTDGHTVYQESKVYLDENFSIWLLIDNQDNLSVQTSTGRSPGYELVNLADDCKDSLRASATSLGSAITVPTNKKVCLYKEDPNNDNGDLHQLYADSTDYPQLTIEDPASDVVTATVTPADTILSYQAIDQNTACNQDLPFTTYTTIGAPLVYDQKICFKADSNGYTVYQESEVYLDLEITIIPVSNDGTDVVIKATATLNATMERKLVASSANSYLHQDCDGQTPLACCELASAAPYWQPIFSPAPYTYDGSEVTLSAVDYYEGNVTDNLLDAQGGIVGGIVGGSLVCFVATAPRDDVDYSATAAFYATPDTVAPEITIDQTGNSLTASVSDDWDSNPTFEYELITSEACGSNLTNRETYDVGSIIIDLDPDQKACFYAEDGNDNTSYEESEPGVDLSPPTPPTITVSGVIDNQVSATATDNGTGVDSFAYQLIPAGTVCNETLTTPFNHPYIKGTLITLEYDQEACFKASDASGASGYRGSTPGLDITDPTIDITGPDGSNVVTATATDDGTGVTSFERQLITGEDCDGDLLNFTSYDGSDITLVDGQSICFKATDGASNESYRGSTAGVDITKPTISITQLFNQITAATASDDVDGSLPLYHQLITGEPCDGNLNLADFTSYDGATIDLDIGESVCFKATDAAGNEFYLGSAAGADTTLPTITVSSVINNQVSATAADDSGLVPALNFHLISVDAVCNDQVEFFAPYDGPITLPIGKKACFRATDGAGNKFYAASAAGADTTPPTITITGPDISSNIVSATATDTSGVTPSIEALLINKNTDCDLTLVTTFDSYTAGDPLPLGARQKACFKASDDDLNVAYKDSAAANDISAPVITVTEPDANSQVSASVTDDADDNPYLSYQIIAADDTCDGSLAGSFIGGYVANTPLTIYGGKKACFRATDDAGRISYQASGAIPLNQPTITSISLNDVTKQTIIKKNGSISIKVDYSAGVEIDRPNGSTWPKLILNNQAEADFDAQTTFPDPSQPDTTATSTSHYFKYRVDSGDDISELDVSSYDFNNTSVRRPITWDELDSALPVGSNLADDADIEVDASPPTIVVVQLATNQVGAIASDANGISYFFYDIYASSLDCTSTTDYPSYEYDYQVITLEADEQACFYAGDGLGQRSATVSSDAAITPTDTSPPLITISELAGGSVSATASDADQDLPVELKYQLIGIDATCSSALTTDFEAYSQGDALSLALGQMACFRARNQAFLFHYLASAGFADNDDPEIDVGLVVDNKVSATVDDDLDSSPSFESQIIASTVNCGDSLTSGFDSYLPGDVLSLDYGQKACFRATDSSGNTDHAASTIGKDLIAPEIEVSSVSSDNKVSARASDDETGISSFTVLVIAQTTDCDDQVSFGPYSNDQLLTLLYDQKACFKAVDGNDNTVYSWSDAGSDILPPVITITVLTGNQVSAIATDTVDSSLIFEYKYIYGQPCEADLIDWTSYTAADPLDLDTDQRVCFRAIDDAGNPAYKQSVAGADISPPQIVSIQAVSGFDGPRGIGDLVEIMVSFDEPVTVTGNPSILVASSNPVHKDNPSFSYARQSSDRFGLIFSYTVLVKDQLTNINGRLFFIDSAQAHQIVDAHNNPATDFSLPAANNLADNNDIDLDGIAPAISVVAVDSNSQTSATIFEEIDANPTFEFQIIDNLTDCDDRLATSFASYTVSDLKTLTAAQRVCFRASDAAGNVTYKVSGGGLDSSPPEIVAIVNGANQVTATATDNSGLITGFWYVLITTETCANGLSFVLYEEGDAYPLAVGQKACFKAKDGNGLFGYAESDAGADKIAPIVTVSAGSAADSFKAVDDETASTDWAYVLITNNTCNSTTSFSGSTSYTEGDDVVPTAADNTKQICFRSTDNSGNHGYGLSATINVDSTAPVVTVSRGSVDDTFQANDNDSGPTTWAYVLITNNSCNSTTSFSGSSSYDEGDDVVPTEADNTKQLCFRSTDSSGNHGYGSSTTINVDQTAPVITVVASDSVGLSLKATDDDDGTTSWHYIYVSRAVDCNFDDADFASALDYSEGDDLSYTVANNQQFICFRSTDGSGNQGFGVSRKININTDPIPLTVSVGSKGNSYKATTSYDQAQFTRLKYIDGDQPCDLRQINDFVHFIMGHDVNYQASSNGRKICFRIESTSNNRSGYAASPILVYDDIAPTITITDGSVANSFKARDDDQDPTRWRYVFVAASSDCRVSYVDDGTDYQEGDDVVYTDAQDNHRLCFKSRDNTHTPNAGLAGSRTIDLTAPLISVSGVSAINQVSASVSDTVDDEPSFDYQIIDKGTGCNDQLTGFKIYDGRLLDLVLDKKACFKAVDADGNVRHAASTAGADITDPVILLGTLSNNQVSATVSDDSAQPIQFYYKRITDQDCDDSLTGLTPYTAGSSLTLTAGQKVCFKATDAAGNTDYAISGLGIDNQGPAIDITGPDGSNQVRATATDTEVTVGSFGSQVIAEDVSCDDQLAATSFATYSGGDIPLSYGYKVCFKAVDTNDNTSYADSDPGADITDPQITVSLVSSDNKVSARASDTETAITSFGYQYVAGDTVCDDQLSFTTTYSDDQPLPLLYNQKACFRAVDGNNNIVYSQSDAGVDIIDPQITVSPLGSDNRVSASASDTETAITSFGYQYVAGDTVCDDQLVTTFAPYSLSVNLVLSYNQKVCFKAVDGNGNVDYADSAPGADITKPQITVGLLSSDNKVSASAADTDTSVTSFGSQVIAEDVGCDDQLASAFATYSGGDILLSYGDKACFKAVDTNDNTSYADSDAGADITDPHITVSSVSASNQVSADVTDNSDQVSLSYQRITDQVCGAGLDNFTGYAPNSPLILESGQKICFRAVDGNNNTVYSQSDAGADITDPKIVLSTVTNNQVSATVSDDYDDSVSFGYQFIDQTTICSDLTSGFGAYNGGQLSLAVGQRACFRATDAAGNTDYQVSTAGIDAEAPAITIDGPDASNQLTATVSDSDDNSPSFEFQLITTEPCGVGLSNFRPYDGSSLTLVVGQKVCFRAEDASTNTSYQVSTAGADITAPQITVSPLSLVNQVSASVSDDTDLNPSFGYQFVAEDAVCGAGLSTAFTTYAANFVLMVAVGQKACFKASDDQVNTSYQQSTVGVDDSPPQITVTSLDANNQLTASASDNIDPNPDISYQQLADSVVCGANLTAGFSDYDGSAVSLALNHKLCFRATDAADNTSYQHSPSRFDLAKPQIVISPVNGANQVSAIVSDADDPAPSFYYQLVDGATVCGASLSNFTGYIAGDQLSLAVNYKACFKASDSADNSAYAASTVGLDISQPSLVVTAVSATNQVSASASDDNDLNPSFGVQLITDQDCGDDLTDFSVYDGRLLSLAVDQRACFKASDSADNTAYAVSGLGVDISSPQITVGALDANNQVSASVSDDNDLNPTFGVQLITTQDCGDGLTDFSAYDGSPLSLAAGQRACFRASDSADNRAYAVSGRADDQPVVDNQPPVITISGLDAGNNLSATASDDSLFISSFGYQFMAAGTSCGDQLTSLADYVAGSQLSLRAGQQVCFRAADSANNTSYLASAAGADISAPTITTDLNTANNQLMITVVDDYDANPSLSYQLVTTEVCGDNLTNFTGYTGTIQLTANSRACLMATDAAGNSSYLLSEAGIQLITAVGSSSRPASSTISQLAGDSGLPKLFWLGAAVFTVAGLLAVYGRRRMI